MKLHKNEAEAVKYCRLRNRAENPDDPLVFISALDHDFVLNWWTLRQSEAIAKGFNHRLES